MKHLRFLSFGKLAAAFLFSFLSVQSYGQTVSLNTVAELGSFGDPEINGNSGDACVTNIGSPSTATYSLTLNNGTLNSPTYNWSIKGGFNLISSSGASATVEPFVDTEGRYNKGRLTVFYKGTVDSTYTVTLTDVCGDGETREEEVTIQVPRSGIAYVDLYQEFNHSETIVGDVCVESGQREAYSIKDLVSGNLEQGIGIDEYTWDLSDLTVPDPIVTNPYSSGDNSAKTLTFGIQDYVDNIANKQISVVVGKCNSQATAITFKGELEPQEITPTTAGCIPTSTTTLELSHPSEANVTYTWELPPQYTFAAGYGPTSNPVVININTSAGEVTLIAEAGPSSDYCTQEPQEVTYEVKRSLGASDVISGATCVEEGTTYQYSITPNPGAEIDWSLPTGWSIVGGAANENASTIEVDVASNSVSGTIMASTSGCGGSGIELDVNVKPGNPGAITGETCLDGTESYVTYSVTPVSPAADSYEWDYPSGWTSLGSTSNSVTLIPDGSTSGAVSVEALGQEGCDADAAATLDILYGGVQPDAIVQSACIASGMEDNITFSIQTPVSGQTYEWDIPSGWTIDVNNNTNIEVTTNGIDGSYDVKARASNVCGVSSWKTLDVDIDGTDFDFLALEGGSGALYELQNIEGDITPDQIDWYINDVYQESGDGIYLNGTTTATLCAVLHYNGCQTRKCRSTDYANAARMSNPSGLKNSAVEGVQVSPNPASDNLMISVPGKFTSGSYELLSVDGKIAKSGSLKGSETQVNTTEVSSGTYILKTETDGNVTISKVLIQK